MIHDSSCVCSVCNPDVSMSGVVGEVADVDFIDVESAEIQSTDVEAASDTPTPVVVEYAAKKGKRKHLADDN